MFDISRLVCNLQEEVERLRAGRFTPEEFQNLCHGLAEDDKEAFFAGCADYQRKLFGVAACDELPEHLPAEIEQIRERLEKVKRENPSWRQQPVYRDTDQLLQEVEERRDHNFCEHCDGDVARRETFRVCGVCHNKTVEFLRAQLAASQQEIKEWKQKHADLKQIALAGFSDLSAVSDVVIEDKERLKVELAASQQRVAELEEKLGTLKQRALKAEIHASDVVILRRWSEERHTKLESELREQVAQLQASSLQSVLVTEQAADRIADRIMEEVVDPINQSVWKQVMQIVKAKREQWTIDVHNGVSNISTDHRRAAVEIIAALETARDAQPSVQETGDEG